MICLRWLCQFKIFSIIPATGSISLSNVAVIASVPLPQLKRIIHMAMTNGLFISPLPDRVAHSATSLLLSTSPEFSGWATYVSDQIFDASAKLPEATKRWGRSEEISHSAFNEAFATVVPFPEYLAKNPAMGKVLGNFLKATEMVDANSSQHLVNGFDWETLGEATVVDVSHRKQHSPLLQAASSYYFSIVGQ
jgi:6-hydroxytryprostatin B O-methyltransferase